MESYTWGHGKGHVTKSQMELIVLPKLKVSEGIHLCSIVSIALNINQAYYFVVCGHHNPGKFQSGTLDIPDTEVSSYQINQ